MGFSHYKKRSYAAEDFKKKKKNNIATKWTAVGNHQN